MTFSIQHILLPTDFSSASERACDTAVELAELYGAELTLVHALEPAPYPYPVSVDDAIRSATESELEAVAARLRIWVPKLHVTLAAGRPWEAITTRAEKEGADVVVLGTHGRRGITRMVLGTVTGKVVRACAAPVLTVPGWMFADRTSAGAELEAALASLRVQSPVFVALSRGAVPIAAELARRLGGALDVWLVNPVSANARVVGAVDEAGAERITPLATETIDPGALRGAFTAALEALRKQVTAVRGTRAAIDVQGRTVVLVADAAAHPEPMELGADMARRRGAVRLIAAVPVASRSVLDRLRAATDELAIIHATVGLAEPVAWYRDASEPNDKSARALLSAAASTTRAPNGVGRPASPPTR